MDWIRAIPTWVNTFSDNPEYLRLAYSGAIGVAVFILALALYFLVKGASDPVRKRLKSVAQPVGRPGTSPGMSPGASPGAPPRASPGAPQGAIVALGAMLLPKGDIRRRKIEAMLREAGFRAPGAIQIFYGIKLATLVLGPLLVFAGIMFAWAMPIGDALMYLAIAAILCYLAPNRVLRRLAQRRQDRLRRGLPDAMDLLVVCSEAGLGLSAGIQRVAGEIALAHPDLADEFGLFAMQTRSGLDNRAALKDLEERTGLADIQSLVTMLLQGMRFGTSIADTLRIYAEELRDKRLQRAQEQAARVSTLMIFPLVLCIMPAFLLVVLGPAILGAMAAFSRSSLAS